MWVYIPDRVDRACMRTRYTPSHMYSILMHGKCMQHNVHTLGMTARSLHERTLSGTRDKKNTIIIHMFHDFSLTPIDIKLILHESNILYFILDFLTYINCQ